MVGGSGPSLMRRDMSSLLDISSFSINRSSVGSSWVVLFPELFSPGLGCFTDREVSQAIHKTIAPKFCKPRPIPYALRDKVDVELR